MPARMLLFMLSDMTALPRQRAMPRERRAMAIRQRLSAAVFQRLMMFAAAATRYAPDDACRRYAMTPLDADMPDTAQLSAFHYFDFAFAAAPDFTAYCRRYAFSLLRDILPCRRCHAVFLHVAAYALLFCFEISPLTPFHFAATLFRYAC